MTEQSAGSHPRTKRPRPDKISFLLSDVDGTLVDPKKQLTEGAIAAVRALHEAGVGFSVTSSRPPRGLKQISQTLGISDPIAGFNGGRITSPDLETVLDRRVLDPAIARRVIAELRAWEISIWVFSGNDWVITDPAGPKVDLEEYTVQFPPTIVADFEAVLGDVGKIVGVTDDHEKLARCETHLQQLFAHEAAVARSQSYYLDISDPEANKGAAVHALSRLLDIPVAEIAVIGDMGNDLAMFREAGYAIAMGQSTDAFKAEADAVTLSNAEDGFAHAVRRFILGQR